MVFIYRDFYLEALNLKIQGMSETPIPNNYYNHAARYTKPELVMIYL